MEEYRGDWIENLQVSDMEAALVELFGQGVALVLFGARLCGYAYAGRTCLSPACRGASDHTDVPGVQWAG